MKFAYVQYEVGKSATAPDGVVLRPEINIRINGPSGQLVIAGLLDTGSDETILPTSLANLIGVDVAPLATL